jgi:hypothetical protein
MIDRRPAHRFPRWHARDEALEFVSDCAQSFWPALTRQVAIGIQISDDSCEQIGSLVGRRQASQAADAPERGPVLHSRFEATAPLAAQEVDC